MAKTDYKTINEYHQAHSLAAQQRMQSIRDIVHRLAPGVEEVISYQIPCFKYKGYLVYYAAFANHISLSYPFSHESMERFEKELKNYKVSRAAIQFPNAEPLPLELIERIIAFRKRENEQNETMKKSAPAVKKLSKSKV